MKKISIIALCIMLIDQIIKCILVYNLDFGNSITIINNFLSITLVGNTGAAFSILSSKTILLIVISFLSLSLIYDAFIKDKDLSSFEKIVYGVLIGGILGNLIDRITRGYVVDYIDFNILNYNAPIFNFADSCIVISICIIIFMLLRGSKNG